MCLNKISFVLAAFLLFFPFVRAEALFGFTARAAQNEMIEQVSTAYAEGDYKTAEEISREFLVKYPSASKKRLKKVYLFLGGAYKAEGQYDKALLVYNEAVEFLPKDEDVNIALGGIYLIGGLTDNAKEIYRRVLAINKANKDAVLGLARAHYEDGFFSRATMFFKEYEEASAGEELPSSFFYYYAMAQYFSNHSDLALELAFKSLSAEETPDTLMLIAKIYKNSADEKNALKYLNMALDKAPERTDIYLTKALWLAFDKDTAAEGGKMADAVLLKDGRDKLALFIKYLSLARLGASEAQSSVYLKKITDLEGDQLIDKLADKLYKAVSK